jgi:hypothetical protein
MTKIILFCLSLILGGLIAQTIMNVFTIKEDTKQSQILLNEIGRNLILLNKRCLNEKRHRSNSDLEL